MKSRSKLSDNQKNEVIIRARAGERQSALAREYGVTQGYVSKIVAAGRKPTEYNRFSALHVELIVAVADASIPSGLTELARLMGRSLLDVVDVCSQFRSTP